MSAGEAVRTFGYVTAAKRALMKVGREAVGAARNYLAE
jgi:hypothetical protein